MSRQHSRAVVFFSGDSDEKLSGMTVVVSQSVVGGIKQAEEENTNISYSVFFFS